LEVRDKRANDKISAASWEEGEPLAPECAREAVGRVILDKVSSIGPASGLGKLI